MTDALTAAADTPVAAGVVIRAQDTGRVLMLQRGLDPADPAAGCWEFPGGKLEPGETPAAAAAREWCEETGCAFPDTAELVGQWESPDGVYQGFVYQVPSETDVPVHLGRQVANPDDPDGDIFEACAWWAVSDLMNLPAPPLRPEVAESTPWEVIVGTEPNEAAVLAADASPQQDPPQALEPAAELPTMWEGCLAPLCAATGPIDCASGDGRALGADGGSWRPLPLPFGWQTQLNMGHDGAGRVGSIATLEIRDDGMFDQTGPYIYGNGPLDIGSEMGAEYARRLAEGFAGGVSVDIDEMTVELRYADGTPVPPEEGGDGMILMASGAGGAPVWRMTTGSYAQPDQADGEQEIIAYATTWRLMGVTAVDHPAFYQAKITPMAAQPAAIPAQVDPEMDGERRFLTMAEARAAADGELTPAVGDKVGVADPDGSGDVLPGEIAAVNGDGSVDVTVQLALTVAAGDLLPAPSADFPTPDDMGAGEDGELTAAAVFTVLGSPDLPVADRGLAWDGQAALDRVFARATGGDGQVDVAEVAKAFLYRADDADPMLKGSYKLGYADVVDGELKIVPAGIAACTGAHGVDAVDGMSPEDRAKVEARACSVYETVSKTYDDWPACPYGPGKQPAHALVAAAPASAPAAWFSEPPADADPTRMHIGADGRIYGFLATWGVCHVGFPDTCITAPQSKADYSYFHTGQIITAEGGELAVGQITVGTGHASPIGLSVFAARAHYDDTGSAAADIRIGENAVGIWYAGAIRPGVSEQMLSELRAAGRLSGDWREVVGNLELIAALGVNVPGFPLVKPTAGVVGGRQVALVAAGIPPVVPLEDQALVAGAGRKTAAELTPSEFARQMWAEYRAIEQRAAARARFQQLTGRDPASLALAERRAALGRAMSADRIRAGYMRLLGFDPSTDAPVAAGT